MRDVLIIGIACAAAILLGAWLYFSDISAPTGSVGGTAFTIIDQGSNSGAVTERKNYRIKDQEDLEALWKMVHGTGAPTNVDFTKNEVIAVFDGTHATGGYGISIVSITDTSASARAVVIRHSEPGADCTTSDAITSPFQIVQVPKSAYPLSHTDEVVTVACD